MAPAPTPKFDAQAVFERYMAADEAGRTAIYGTLTSNTQRKKLTDLVAKANAEAEEQGSEPEFGAPGESGDEGPVPPMPTVTKKGKEKVPAMEGVSDAEILEMWNEIDKFDISTIDPEDLRIFEYEGFNPDEILRALMKQKKVNNVSNKDFQRDIAILCGLAIVKGNVNDNNFKKMKTSGQTAFTKLASLYGIKNGSAKGQSSDVITVSRIAATFPGIIIRLLHDSKVKARLFPGVMKSSKIPELMRHQALAACIPRDLADDSKQFILSAITAFSVDQTMAISPKKPTVEQALKDQTNFIRVAHEGRFPKEEVRKAIFNSYAWVNYFEDIKTCVAEVSKKDDSHKVIERSTFVSDINKISS